MKTPIKFHNAVELQELLGVRGVREVSKDVKTDRIAIGVL
jgi:hypothetical protein